MLLRSKYALTDTACLVFTENIPSLTTALVFCGAWNSYTVIGIWATAAVAHICSHN